MATKST